MTDTTTLCTDDALFDVGVEALYARAFGPGRFAKAAARLREGNTCFRAYSFVAHLGNDLVGACRLWPVNVGVDAPALFLGPIAVDYTIRNAGLGQRLIEACLMAVDSAGDHRSVILVGDHSYFGKMGFEIVPKGAITMPGPVDPARLLWRPARTANIMPTGRLSVPRATTQVN